MTLKFLVIFYFKNPVYFIIKYSTSLFNFISLYPLSDLNQFFFKIVLPKRKIIDKAKNGKKL